MQNWISANVSYPAAAVTNKEEGTVYVCFTVSEDGTLENAEIAQGVSQNLNDAALNVVAKMPVNELLAGSEKYGTNYIVPIKFVIK